MDMGPELSRTCLITLGWSGNRLTGVLIFRKENSMKQITNKVVGVVFGCLGVMAVIVGWEIYR